MCKDVFDGLLKVILLIDLLTLLQKQGFSLFNKVYRVGFFLFHLINYDSDSLIISYIINSETKKNNVTLIQLYCNEFLTEVKFRLGLNSVIPYAWCTCIKDICRHC